MSKPYRLVEDDIMKKSKQLTGLGIVELDNGIIIGKIDTVIFYPGVKNLLGFSVSCGKWIKRKKVLNIKNVVNIGKHAVMVKNENVLTEISSCPDINEAMKEKTRVFGLIVMTDTGEELGYIEDIIIDESNYTIEGYVLSDGIFEDIFNGKSIVPFAEEMIFGKDTVIINNDYKNIIMKNDIYLKKVFKKAGDSDIK